MIQCNEPHVRATPLPPSLTLTNGEFMNDKTRAQQLKWLGNAADIIMIGEIRDLETAKALASTAFAKLEGRGVLLDVPHHTPEWAAWLGARGFTEQRRLTRMYRGTKICPGVEVRTFAVSGPELG